MILECNGRNPHEMVKGVVKCMKVEPVKKRPVDTKKCKMCCIKSCNAFVQTVCKSKKFCYRHGNPEHEKDASNALKGMLKLVGGFVEDALEERRKQRRH